MKHIPVLLQETIDSLHPRKGMIFLDGTFGAGGHSKALARELSDELTIVAIDVDRESLDTAVADFMNISKAKIIPINTNFRNFDYAIIDRGISSFDAVLLDLGFSSDQMDESKRGFTFQKDEVLQMSLKTPIGENDLTAEEIVNNWEFENLRDIIKYYGDEKYANSITKGIVRAREEKRIQTTKELVEIIENNVPFSYRKMKIHPATKTFQALRIAVNDELGNLRTFLDKIPQYTTSGTRISIISFHSLEDRIVKNKMRDWEQDGIGTRIHKKPIGPTEKEKKENPRSRSAKLRTIEIN